MAAVNGRARQTVALAYNVAIFQRIQNLEPLEHYLMSDAERAALKYDRVSAALFAMMEDDDG